MTTFYNIDYKSFPHGVHIHHNNDLLNKVKGLLFFYPLKKKLHKWFCFIGSAFGYNPIFYVKRLHVKPFQFNFLNMLNVNKHFVPLDSCS